ncbi:hypothetical protein PGN35_011200 [Nodosilinea sp. PGN35]|uniref:ribbon-helix-helix domain-containing protein n=1 Tax=Nodosilinea sp. PGN35 TaxID=3020489 RepID=UPI0023B24E24|nr:ribbon-helix-helix domain-containing protein [Nodosilinea sp. TSF1-S3]MDF0366403.1 ribbon-helix-helix domain-containing protein [Nodosilinea sp. TSF1-S3]
MPTLTRVSTTDMEVTSIRLERSLKEKLKALAGNRGYQALIRDILWQYVEQGLAENPAAGPTQLRADDICASFGAVAECEQVCALTGNPILAHTPMRLGLTAQGRLVPLCLE